MNYKEKLAAVEKVLPFLVPYKSELWVQLKGKALSVKIEPSDPREAMVALYTYSSMVEEFTGTVGGEENSLVDIVEHLLSAYTRKHISVADKVLSLVNSLKEEV